MVVCLIFGRIIRMCFFCLCVFILYMEFAIQKVDCWNILSYEWYANDLCFMSVM